MNTVQTSPQTDGLSDKVASRNSDVPPSIPAIDHIVSVNAKGARTGGNRQAKAIFVILCVVLLLGFLVLWGQSSVSAMKARMMAAKATVKDGPDLLNPEAARVPPPQAGKLGAAGTDGVTLAAKRAPPVGGGLALIGGGSDIRPIRGPDGRVILDGQGNSMGVDTKGNVVSVPAIQTNAGDVSSEGNPGSTGSAAGGNKRPLPGLSTAKGQGGSGVDANGQPLPRPPSRFGGALFTDIALTSGTNAATASSPEASRVAAPPVPAGRDLSAAGNQRELAALYAGAGTAGQSAASGLPSLSSGAGSGIGRSGTVAAQLSFSPTPVARATQFSNQFLVLPKGRQADCVLTTRVIDEVPGFMSCVLTQNLYSDNGKVLLLERGSELSGDYGITSQYGSHRLFGVWNRIKTPSGIEVDMASPGGDSLGTAGMPGHLDQRWGERIGAGLLLSFFKDVSEAAVNRSQPAGTGTTISLQTQGRNTLNSGFSLAEEVVKQTIKVRPTLTINEGDRISIYVARDLDFTSVYALRNAGALAARSN